LELRPHEARRPSCLITAALPSAITISRATDIPGGGEHLLWDLATEKKAEDGCLCIYETGDQATIAFMNRGAEVLRQLLSQQKRDQGSPRS
jgi:hypothetical protein